MKLLSSPRRGSGSDMVFSSQYAAYDVLSAHMQTYLKSLTALHSAERQASDAQAASLPVRRPPITTEHPLIRTNPVTGWNALFFNPAFVTRIVGIPSSESDAIMRYLTEVVATTHARVQLWRNDVAVWDSRVTVRFIVGCWVVCGLIITRHIPLSLDLGLVAMLFKWRAMVRSRFWILGVSLRSVRPLNRPSVNC